MSDDQRLLELVAGLIDHAHEAAAEGVAVVGNLSVILRVQPPFEDEPKVSEAVIGILEVPTDHNSYQEGDMRPFVVSYVVGSKSKVVEVTLEDAIFDLYDPADGDIVGDWLSVLSIARAMARNDHTRTPRH